MTTPLDHRVVAVAGPTDSVAQDGALIVPFDVPGHPNRVGDSSRDVFAAHDLTAAPIVADLLRLAMTAYVADMRVSRSDAFDGWTRRIFLELFVSDVDRWCAAADTVNRLLAFLTGDEWSITFRPTPAGYAPVASPKNPQKTVRVPTVALLSGGLDSFIGAIDLISVGGVAFVSHHGGGGGATSRSQAEVEQVLQSAFGAEHVPVLQFWFAPPHVAQGVTETTTRGRSFLFLALGIATAAAAGANRLVIPENGMISLNVPLTPPRLGSLSTRTTHPYYIALIRELLTAMGISVEIDLPYRFATKGEMLQKCRNPSVLAQGIAITMSCSHPDSQRFQAKNPYMHCGRCLPCLIRRAATYAWGNDPTPYATTDLSASLSGDTGADLRVVRIALDRFSRRAPTIADVLSAGPLPVCDSDLLEHIRVFQRGIEELASFLKQYPEQ